MRKRITQRTVYLVTAALALAMIGGFTMAILTTGQTNTSYQGSQTTTVSSVTGLSYVSTQLVELSSAVTSTTCTSGTPCSVTSAGATDCAGGFTGSTTCAGNDYVELLDLTTVASTAFPGAGTVALTVYVTGTPVGGSAATFSGTTFYYSQASSRNTAQTIVIDFDIGTASSGPGTVATVTVIANVV